MSKASVYAELSGIDRRVIDALMPTLNGQEDGAVVDQLLNLASSLEGVDIGLAVELVGQLQHRCKKDAVIGGLIEFCQQSVPKSQQQPERRETVSQRTERSASPNEHDLVETVSPQQRKGTKGGILSWFAYNHTPQVLDCDLLRSAIHLNLRRRRLKARSSGGSLMRHTVPQWRDVTMIYLPPVILRTTLQMNQTTISMKSCSNLSRQHEIPNHSASHTM